MEQLTRAAVRNRQDRYLLDHYMNLHAALISVAVAVAGLAAASVVVCSGGWEAALRSGMLVVTLLVTANVYLGLLVGGLLLPYGEPTVWDFLFPLLVGVSEFVAFGLLVVDQHTCGAPSPVPSGQWLCAVGVTCLLASGAIERARHHVDREDRYAEDLRATVTEYKSRLRCDRHGSLAVTAIGLVGGIVVLAGWLPEWIVVVAVVLLALILTIGIVIHQQTANCLYESLRVTQKPSEKPVGKADRCFPRPRRRRDER